MVLIEEKLFDLRFPFPDPHTDPNCDKLSGVWHAPAWKTKILLFPPFSVSALHVKRKEISPSRTVALHPATLNKTNQTDQCENQRPCLTRWVRFYSLASLSLCSTHSCHQIMDWRGLFCCLSEPLQTELEIREHCNKNCAQKEIQCDFFSNCQTFILYLTTQESTSEARPFPVLLTLSHQKESLKKHLTKISKRLING